MPSDNPPVEPIAASAGSALRPSGATADASALLRQGRILAAEVLARSPDGTVQLALGRHVVPAKTELRMEAGARFLVEVALEGGEPVLHLLAPRADEDGALAAALRRVIGAERPLGERLAELARALRAGASAGLPEEAVALARLLESIVVRPGEAGAGAPGGPGLRAILLALGLGHEAALAASAGAPRGETAGLRGDLKALLLRALGRGIGEEETAAAIRGALDGLEAEQLLNLARARAGEPVVLSFPFADGERWATARLAVPSREREADAEGRESEPDVFRVALAVELSRLGPVRADLALTPGRLAVRLTVTTAELARALEPGLARLRERLDGRRALDIGVRAGTRDEVEQGFRPLDVRYLREHPLVDLAG